MGKHNIRIYQAKVEADYCFLPYKVARSCNANFKDLTDYNLVYVGVWTSASDDITDILEDIFREGNMGYFRHLMAEYYNGKARSISVSDIIVVDGTRYYCDSFGFKKI